MDGGAISLAYKLGGKYFDAFTVKNLDLQGEMNMVRPYTYTHYDSTANYTHYNQPLAHPLGAGFAEVHRCDQVPAYEEHVRYRERYVLPGRVLTAGQPIMAAIFSGI